MKRKVANKWIDLLLSGKFKQTRVQLGAAKKGEALGVVDPKTGKYPEPSKFCCLGVLCKVYNNSKEGKLKPVVGNEWYNGALPPRVANWAGIKDEYGRYRDGVRGTKKYLNAGLEYNLANLNDVSKKGFKYIAGVIQKHVKDL